MNRYQITLLNAVNDQLTSYNPFTFGLRERDERDEHERDERFSDDEEEAIALTFDSEASNAGESCDAYQYDETLVDTSDDHECETCVLIHNCKRYTVWNKCVEEQ